MPNPSQSQLTRIIKVKQYLEGMLSEGIIMDTPSDPAPTTSSLTTTLLTTAETKASAGTTASSRPTQMPAKAPVFLANDTRFGLFTPSSNRQQCSEQSNNSSQKTAPTFTGANISIPQDNNQKNCQPSAIRATKEGIDFSMDTLLSNQLPTNRVETKEAGGGAREENVQRNESSNSNSKVPAVFSPCTNRNNNQALKTLAILAVTQNPQITGMREEDIDDDTDGIDDTDDEASSKKKLNKYVSFDERCKELIEYKKRFGDCNVPLKYADNPSLGGWCGTMRKGCIRLNQGKKPKVNLTHDRVKRLKEIGFNCSGVSNDACFEKRCQELERFKAKHGHCDVPSKYVENPALGKWCAQVKCALRQQQKGKKTRYKLSKDRIGRLEDIGVNWDDHSKSVVFDKRCRELAEFKVTYGHCNVPKRYHENPALGRWCGNLRVAFGRKMKGERTSYNISQERIGRLEEIGFQWKAK